MVTCVSVEAFKSKQRPEKLNNRLCKSVFKRVILCDIIDERKAFASGLITFDPNISETVNQIPK